MTARGIRNNNPGNIRRQGFTMWQGQTIIQGDASFVTFSSMTMGIRALAKTLLTYQHKDRCYTVTDIISRWAPPSENNTPAYIAAVAKAAGVPALLPVDLSQLPAMIGVVSGIVLHENGQDAGSIRLRDLSQGCNMALAG